MAFVDTFFGDPFLNVTQRVGKTGAFDDLLFVQIMLKFLFTHRTDLQRVNPVKGEISVTGQPAKDTPILIAAYQKHAMKRAKPEGFINRASGSDTQKERFTIVRMNTDCLFIAAALRLNFENVLELLAFLSPFAQSPILKEPPPFAPSPFSDEPRVISKF